MTQKRRQYNGQFKFEVAIEAANEVKTTNQIASEYEAHLNQVSGWKDQLFFSGRPSGRNESKPPKKQNYMSKSAA